jgi:hypothetical protein
VDYFKNKNKKIKRGKMRNGTYTAQRRSSSQEWRGNATRGNSAANSFGSFGGFSRNRNTVRFSGSGKLGRFTLFGIFALLLVELGFVYVDQSSKTTKFDYQLSDLSSQIDDLEARKEDLAVERARLTSIANSNNSKVAAAMENASDAEYAY